MGEKLGEAILELRTDDSGLTAGIAKAKTSAQDLGNTFTSAGQRAGSSLGGLASSANAAGAAASSMAAGAQLSARAAVGLAGDAERATVSVGHLAGGSSIATRELLTLFREASNGNFTRMAGSASILATALQGQGASIKGLVTNLLTLFGILQTTTNAELAAEAAAAGAAAESVELAAKRAAANVMVADTEVALAEAAIRNATTATEAAAAQKRLAAANVEVAAAAEEATIAEDALSVAQGRAAETAAASAATTRTSYTALGATLIATTAVAAVAFGAFKAFQMQVGETGELDHFAESLRLTTSQIEAAGGKVKYLGDQTKEISGLTVTAGDVFAGLWKTIADHTGADDSIAGFKRFVINQFELLLKAGVDIFAQLYGDIVGTYRAAIVIWENFPAALGDVFYSAVNAAIGALNRLVKASVDGVDGFIATVNAKLGTSIGMLAAPQIAQVANQYAGAAKKVISAVSVETTKATAEARAAANAIVAETEKNIIGAAEKRLQATSDSNRPPKPPKPKKEKKPKEDQAAAELAKLDAQIVGENELTQAYLTSDAAVIKAEADQKALTLAVEKHATAAQTTALKDKELALAIATIEAEAAKLINNLNFESQSRKKVNDEVAAGLVPAAQMQQQLELEAKLRPLIAAYDVADAAGKAKLAAEIRNLTDAQAKSNAETSRSQALQDEASNNDELDKLRLEASLIGASNRERAVALAQLEAEQKLKTMQGLSVAEQQAYIQSYVDKANASVVSPWQQWADSIPQTTEAIHDALQTIAVKDLGSFNDGLANALTTSTSLHDLWHNLGSVFHSAAQQILSDLLRIGEQEAELALFGRNAQGSSGGGGGLLSTILGAIGSIGGAVAGGGGGGSGAFMSGGSTGFVGLDGLNFGGAHALGGLIPQGTFGIVGEKGPEPIIATPRGAMVLPNSSLRQGGLAAANDRGPSVNIVNNNDFRGADAASVAAMSARVDQLESDLPRRVVTTMQDARSRFLWR